MTKSHNDFQKTNSKEDYFYDLEEDWSLVEASIASQYGIRIRQNPDMPWDEFCSLVSGILPDTPLGQIVSIRSEKDTSNFTPQQKKIHSDWQKKIASKKMENPEELNKQMNELSRMLESMFGKKEV